MDKAFLGTELKYLLNIEASGFSMIEDDFEVELIGTNGSNILHKSEFPTDGGGHYYLCFNTLDYGAGFIDAVITAHVPDQDFSDNYRDEVTKISPLVKVLEV